LYLGKQYLWAMPKKSFTVNETKSEDVCNVFNLEIKVLLFLIS
jgi:hypothetical protein